MERVTPLPVKSAGAVLNEGARFARNTDWNLFKIFRQIAQSESIGGAARRLNRQQPTVTAALQRLESHIGLKLCERTHKGIVLTQFGKRVQSICEEIEASLSSIPEAALAARATASDPISVKVISNLHLIPRLNSIFSEFHARLPDTEIKLDTAPWRSVVHAVTAGEADIGIGFIGDGAAPARRLLVLDQVQQLYCGPSHRLLGAAGADIADLQHEPLVISHDEPYENRRFRTVHRLGDAIGGISDNLDERMWLIQLGLGIGFLPSTVVEASPFANKLWRWCRTRSRPCVRFTLCEARSGCRTLARRCCGISQRDICSRRYPADPGLFVAGIRRARPSSPLRNRVTSSASHQPHL